MFEQNLRRGEPGYRTVRTPGMVAALFVSGLDGCSLHQALGAFPAPGKRLDATSLGEMHMLKVTPFLWYDNNAEEAANFYVSIFKNS
jgi:hypothetical protein